MWRDLSVSKGTLRALAVLSLRTTVLSLRTTGPGPEYTVPCTSHNLISHLLEGSFWRSTTFFLVGHLGSLCFIWILSLDRYKVSLIGKKWGAPLETPSLRSNDTLTACENLATCWSPMALGMGGSPQFWVVWSWGKGSSFVCFPNKLLICFFLEVGTQTGNYIHACHFAHDAHIS